jgi:hypothetical protein
MGKQNNTFPEEKPERPVRKKKPKIDQPNDPKKPEIAKKDPQIIPDEYPPETPIRPGII